MGTRKRKPSGFEGVVAPLARWRRGAAVALVLALLGVAPGALAAPQGSKPAPRSTVRPLLFVPSFSANVVSVFDARNDRLVKTIPIHAKGTCCTYLNPDQRTLYVTDGLTNDVTEIDTQTLSVRRVIPVPGTLADRASELSKDGKTFWLTTLVDSKLHAIDTATGRVTKTFAAGSLDFSNSRDGKWLYVVEKGSATPTDFVVRSAATFAEVARIPLPIGSGQEVKVSFDGKKAFLVGNSDGSQTSVPDASNDQLGIVDVSSPSSPHLVKTIAAGVGPEDAEFTPDGRQLWVPAMSDGTITVLDTATNDVVRTISTNLNVCGVGFHDKKAYVLVADNPLPPSKAGIAYGCYHVAGAFVPSVPGVATRPGIDANGAMVVYDRTTYTRTDEPSIPLPSPAYMANLAMVPAA